MKITRRKFLIATAALLAAPAIVRASSLMPVRVIRDDLWYLTDTDAWVLMQTRPEPIFWMGPDHIYLIKPGGEVAQINQDFARKVFKHDTPIIEA